MRYYWLVDPRAQRLEEHEFAGAAYRLLSRSEGTAVFNPALFSGHETPVGRVWKHQG